MTISTEAGPASRSLSRRPRLIEVALILSIALNCFIVGGVVMTAWHFRHPPMPPPDMEVETLAGAAGLSAAETADLLSFARSVHLDAAIARGQNEPLATAYLAELMQPNPRQDVLDKIESQIRSNKVSMHQKVSDDFTNWFRQLDVQKRQFIIARIRDPRDPTTRGFRWIIGM
jgi:cell division protein FtsX